MRCPSSNICPICLKTDNYLKSFPTLFLTDNQTPREIKRDSYVRSHRFRDSWERRRFDRPDTGRRQHRVAPSLNGAAGPKPVFPVAVAVARRWCRGPLRRRSLRESRGGSSATQHRSSRTPERAATRWTSATGPHAPNQDSNAP